MNYRSKSLDNRMLQRYYEVMQRSGQEAADALFDRAGNRVFQNPSAGDLLSDAGSLAGELGAGYYKAVDPMVNSAVRGLQETASTKLAGKGGMALSRFAGNPTVLKGLRLVPGIGAAAGVLGAADVIAGDDSLGNKAMDTAAMLGGGIGGALGTVGGPVGTAIGAAAGAGLGKMGSDSLQWLFGDKKTAEERRMEEALLALRGAR